MPPRSKKTRDLVATAVTLEMIAAYRSEFEAEPRYRVAMNASTQGNLEEVSLNRRVVDGLDWNFSHEVPLGGITAQNNAGTCWIYAGRIGLSNPLFSPQPIPLRALLPGLGPLISHRGPTFLRNRVL